MRKHRQNLMIPTFFAAVIVASLVPGQVFADRQSAELASPSALEGTTNVVIPRITQEWNQLVSGDEDDVFTSVIHTRDGGFLAVGHSLSSASGGITDKNAGKTDALAVKFDSMGNKVWVQLIGGTGDDFFNSVVQTADDGYVAAGYTDSSAGVDLSDHNNGGQDGLIVKLDPNGKKLWDQVFGGSAMDRFYSVIQTSEDNFVAVGEYGSSGTGEITNLSNGSNDGLVVGIDASGKILWHQLIGGSNMDYLASVIETKDGLAVAGGTYSSKSGVLANSNNGSQDGLLVKLTGHGDYIWDQVFGGLSYDRLDGLTQTSDGGFIAVGSTASHGSGDVVRANGGITDGLIVRFDPLGNLAWHRLIGGIDRDGFKSILQKKNDTYVAAGTMGYGGTTTKEFHEGNGFLHCFNGSGEVLWDHLIEGLGNVDFHSLSLAEEGAIVAAGVVSPLLNSIGFETENGDRDALLVKLYSPSSPEISSQPESLMITAGEEAVFTATTLGAPKPTVQWQVKTSPVSDWIDLKGATSETLRFSVKLSDSGTAYRAVFSNQWGTAVSNIADLKVTVPTSLNVIAGANRYLTAAAISQASFAQSDVIVLASGLDFPDALSAGPLAAAVNAPILLTYMDRLSPDTAAELTRLNAKKAIILGGEAAISYEVEAVLRDQYGLEIQRIKGTNRYVTALAAAEFLKTLNGAPNQVVISSGTSFADALSISGYAAGKGYPILTVGETVHPGVLSFLLTSGVDRVIITGGTAAVSEEIEYQIMELGIQVQRISGRNREETSAAIANTFYKTAANAIAANGFNFPDALTAGPYAASLEAPVLLIRKDSVNEAITSYLKASEVTKIDVIGGDGVVSTNAIQFLMDAIN